MTPGPADVPVVPSRNALRVLRRLALAGSTVGSFCAVAAITYDVHRRVSVAERIVENKRALQTSAPRYDATSAARRLSRMMEAAEAGEFMGLKAWKEEERKFMQAQVPQVESDTRRPFEQPSPPAQGEITDSSTQGGPTPITSPQSEITSTTMEPESNQNVPPLKNPNVSPPPPTLPSDARAKYNLLQSNSEEVPMDVQRKPASPPEKHVFFLQMQDLLDRRRYIDAAQVFLDAHPPSLRTISRDRWELAVETFYLNCKEDNVFIARSLFERLEQLGGVSPRVWRIMIVALAKNGCIESAATVYSRFSRRYTVPEPLVDIVLRCLIESHRLTAAKHFLLKHIALDRDCGLCGAYLDGLWKKTRSIELINSQYMTLLEKLRSINKAPTDKLLNPVVKVYVEFGRAADAEALLDEMKKKYTFNPSCRTKGLLVYSKALACDWAAVDNGLEEMHKLGMTTQKRDFVAIFDRIFLEYWVSHTGTEIRTFLYDYIDRFGIVPDQVLYEHVLEAFVEKGDEAILLEFTNMARQRGWDVVHDHDGFLKKLRTRRLALEKSQVGLWKMLHSAQAERARSAASRQLLGYDQRSVPVAAANAMPKSRVAVKWYTRMLQGETASRHVDSYQSLSKQMTHFLHAGKPTEALKCFQDAKSHGYEYRAQHIELAVIATVFEDGVHAARDLIRTELGGEGSGLPMFCRQILNMDPSAELDIIKAAIFRFYNIFWTWTTKPYLVRHHIVASTSHRLIASNKPQMALDVLVAVYESKYGRWYAFDAVCMKMFIRAFAAVGNLAGVRWCILTALARDTAVNRDFLVEAHRIRGALWREYHTDSSVSPKAAQKKKSPLKYLGYALDCLEKKYNGNLDFKKLNGSSEAKKSKRQALQRPLNPQVIWTQQKALWQIIESWDEEYELERVLDRIDTDEDSILGRWNEATCVPHG